MQTDQNQSVQGSNLTRGFILVTMLFFTWGFLTSMNDILVPFFKTEFGLENWRAQLVQSFFFIAYFAMSLVYYILSVSFGDPIARIGYKRGIIIGLLTSAAGAFLFIPAANAESFPMFLGALFVLGAGFTLLQISANPFVTLLGDEKTASSRLNLSQGFNSLGHTLAPLIGGYLIFTFYKSRGVTGFDTVKEPYVIFGVVMVAMAALFSFVNLPVVAKQEKIEPGLGALKFPYVWLGMIAIFLYVGAEISVGSNLIFFLQEEDIAGLTEAKAANYVAIYWGGLMIGRFAGAFTLSEQPFSKKAVAILGSSVICFFVLYAGILAKNNYIEASPAPFMLAEMLPFALLVLVSYGAFAIGKAIPSRTVVVFALLAAAMLGLALFTTGKVAMWMVICVGLFNSIMWSNIFSLAIDGLGKYKSQAASLLVMMILGGGLFPPIQGAVADKAGSVQASFFVPLLAYLYLAFYGGVGYRIGKAKQGISN